MKTLVMGLLFIFAMGCDPACEYDAEDFVNIENRTGQAHSLTICTGYPQRESPLEVANRADRQRVSLGVRRAMRIGTSCPYQDFTIRVRLASASFGQVKLCYDKLEKLHLLLPIADSCPAGTEEQTESGPCAAP